MAVPDYFGRNAVAIAQAISGLDDKRLAEALREVRIGITFGPDAHGKEGAALTDLLIRLLARLYPTLVFRSEGGESGIADSARELARRINPHIELTGAPTVEVVVGYSRLPPWAPQRIFTGCSGWTAAISTSEMHLCGHTDIPFGPGVSACLAAANLFRHVFLSEPHLDTNVKFDILDSTESDSRSTSLSTVSADFVLAGCGAIGNATAWALARTAMQGTITIVDHEAVDLGNLQRYVLAERTDEGSPKPAVAARYFTGSLHATGYENDLASYLETKDYQVERLLLALDSAQDRRAGQASLPRWVANAWTQPGDLGVSTHDFLNGACVCCLYLPERAGMNEDAIIAEAFGVPARTMQIRLLLHRNDGVSRDLLEAIATARDVALDRLLPFEGRPVRALYVEGFCGGAVLPLAQIGTPRAEVHVPLAHQSALAGVLMAAAAVRHALGVAHGSQVTQLDVLKPVPPIRSRPAAKDPRGICICQDLDYREVYACKFPEIVPGTKRIPARKRARTLAQDPKSRSRNRSAGT